MSIEAMETLGTLVIVVVFIGWVIWMAIDPDRFTAQGERERAPQAMWELTNAPITMDCYVVNRRSLNMANPPVHRVVWVDGDIARVRPLHARAHQRRDQKVENLIVVRRAR